MFRSFLFSLGLLLCALPAAALDGIRFASIDGGDYALDDWRGQPVLIANTASLCAFTRQYDALQALQDRYGDAGLVVLAVPSDDFAQELADEDEVREFCEVNFNLTLPMTTITPVTGQDAHPFYQWLRAEHGVVPRWNFTKVLLDADGALVDSYGPTIDPMGRRIIGDIETLLAR